MNAGWMCLIDIGLSADYADNRYSRASPEWIGYRCRRSSVDGLRCEFSECHNMISR